MNNILSVVIIITLFISFSSCTQKAGDWDDNIMLSQKQFTIEANTESIEITTEGEGWWISDIQLDYEYFDFSSVNTTKSTFEIEEEAFCITRNSVKNLLVKMTENQGVNQRELRIGVQSGNYFDGIVVIQKGK